MFKFEQILGVGNVKSDKMYVAYKFTITVHCNFVSCCELFIIVLTVTLYIIYTRTSNNNSNNNNRGSTFTLVGV